MWTSNLHLIIVNCLKLNKSEQLNTNKNIKKQKTRNWLIKIKIALLNLDTNMSRMCWWPAHVYMYLRNKMTDWIAQCNLTFNLKIEWNVKCMFMLTDPHFPPNLNNILKISYQQNHNRMHKDLLFWKKKKSLGYEVFYKPNFFISRFFIPVMSKDLFFYSEFKKTSMKTLTSPYLMTR